MKTDFSGGLGGESTLRMSVLVRASGVPLQKNFQRHQTIFNGTPMLFHVGLQVHYTEERWQVKEEEMPKDMNHVAIVLFSHRPHV